MIRETCSLISQNSPQYERKLGFPDQQGVSFRNLHEPYHLWTYQGSTWKMKNMEMVLSKLPSWATTQVQDRCIWDKVFALDNLSALNTTTKKQTLKTFLRLLQDLPQDNHCSLSNRENKGSESFLKHQASEIPRSLFCLWTHSLLWILSSSSHNFNFIIKAEFSHNMTDG